MWLGSGGGTPRVAAAVAVVIVDPLKKEAYLEAHGT